MPTDSVPGPFRFALPPSLGAAALEKKRTPLERLLADAVSGPVEVKVASSYQAMTDELLSGAVDAAWAPPMVCARIELARERVLLRGVRHGAVTYRAALVSRPGAVPRLDRAPALRAAWVDPESTGGYLLPMAFLRSRGWDPSRLFTHQSFAGSYRAALQQVLDGQADLTSVFAPAGGPVDAGRTGAEEIIPGSSARLAVVALTDEGPADGIAAGKGLASGTAGRLERSLLAMIGEKERALLHELFNVERFELAPPWSYRAFYGLVTGSGSGAPP